MASVLSLASRGSTLAEIVTATGVPRTTVQRWIANGGRASPSTEEMCPRCGDAVLDEHAYAYLLGLYLGDGCITRQPNGTYRLEIYQDARYPRLIAAACTSMAAVLPRRVSTRGRPGSVAVGSYSNHWPCLFPQHGPGRKHQRHIVLGDWQRAIVAAQPEQFVKGLVESDGCRHVNRVRGTNGQSYEYVRYSFSNRSDEIRAMFRSTCEALGLTVTKTNAWGLAVSRRADVARLDSFIGPKS